MRLAQSPRQLSSSVSRIRCAELARLWLNPIMSIDWDQEVVTCPHGKQSRYWKPAPDSRGKPIIQVSFHKKDCTGCVVRSQCTRSTAGPRELTLHPKAQQKALQAARERQQTETFKALYKRRAGIEGTMSQAA